MKIVFLVSGNGDNFVLKALYQLQLFDITVIGYDKNCTGLTFAKKNKLNTYIVNQGNNREELTTNIIYAIKNVKPDVVILLFHRLLGSRYFQEIKIPTINIHPSLLPSFSGFKAIDRAIGHGVKLTGVTVHFVDESEDGGPIIIQAIQPINQNISSYSELLADLNKLYFSCTLQTLFWLNENRIDINEGKTTIKNVCFEEKIFYPNLEKEVIKLIKKVTTL